MAGGAVLTKTEYSAKPPAYTVLAPLEVVATLGAGGVAGVTVAGAGAEASIVADDDVEVLATTLGGLTTTVALGAGALALTVTIGIGGGGGRLATTETLGARIAP
jgi:hypothetical protein